VKVVPYSLTARHSWSPQWRGCGYTLFH